MSNDSNRSTFTIPQFVEQLFTEYYQGQEIVPIEEWDLFMDVIKKPLPSCFRINTNGVYFETIKDMLLSKFQFEPQEYILNSVAISPPRCLPWYPNQGGWQMDCGRPVLRKAARIFPILNDLHSFLVQETDSGHISRQEAVSMIPAFLLDVQPHHKVLDMCAAPGSKTAQLLESLHQGIPLNQDPTGFVVANDFNEKRAFLLVHQTQRLGRSSYVATSHDGRKFPDGIEFDRVLCDVPCSGDGTVRKAPDAWRNWHVGNELSLHSTQIDIAMRSAALLTVGGLMVYSTCTFNPIANEAVISEVLRRCDGALELVDTSSMLPGLLRRPGMSKWKVAWQTKNRQKLKTESKDSHKLQWFQKYEDVRDDLKSRILRSMFPQEDVNVPLHHCLRLVPHDQNTGGFFIALLRKISVLPGAHEEGLSSQCNPDDLKLDPKLPPSGYICKICGLGGHFIKKCPHSTRKNKESKLEQINEKENLHVKEDLPDRKREKASEESMDFRPVSSEQWDIIKEFYGIRDTFLRERLFVRSNGAPAIYLIPSSIQRDCLTNPDLMIINTGIRLFARISTKASGTHYRPAQEGLSILLPFMSKRILYFTLQEFQLLLNSKEGALVPISQLSSTTQAIMQDLKRDTLGAAVAILQDNRMENVKKVRGLTDGDLAVPIWIGNTTTNLLSSKISIDHLKMLLSLASEPIKKSDSNHVIEM